MSTPQLDHLQFPTVDAGLPTGGELSEQHSPFRTDSHTLIPRSLAYGIRLVPFLGVCVYFAFIARRLHKSLDRIVT